MSRAFIYLFLLTCLIFPGGKNESPEFKHGSNCSNQVPEVKLNKDSHEISTIFLKKGLKYLDKGRTDSAEQCLINALKFLSPKSTDVRFLFDCKVKLAFCKLNKDIVETEKLASETWNLLKRNKIEDELSLSSYYKLKTNIYLAKNQYKEAITWGKKNADILSPLSDKEPDELASAYNHLGVCYFKYGVMDSAISYYNRSISFASLTKNKRSVFSSCFNLALLYDIRGSYDNEESVLLKSIKLTDSLNNGNYFKFRVYNSLGILYKKTGVSDKALEAFNKALDYCNKTPSESKGEFWMVYTNLGSLYRNKADYNNALKYYHQALKLIENTSDNNAISQVYNNIANVYYDKKDFVTAKLYYRKSIDLAKGINPLSASNYYRNYASTNDELGNTAETNLFYQKAVNLAKENAGSSYYQLGEFYTDYGQFCLKHKMDNKGLRYYKQAEDIFKINFNSKHPSFSELYANYGDYYNRVQKYPIALRYYQKSITSIVNDFDEKDIYKNPSPDNKIINDIDLLHVFEKKAETFYNLYSSVTGNIKDLDFSLATYRNAIELINKVRTSYNSTESKLYLAENQEKVYSRSIELAMELYGITKNNKYNSIAFEITEKAKAGVLYEQLRENDAKQYASVPDTIILKERKLKNNIASYEKMIYDEKSNPKDKIDNKKINILESQLFALTKSYDRLKDFIKTHYEDYFNYKYINKIYSAPEVQQSLASNDALIEYFIGDKSLYTFLITRNSFKVYSQKIDSSFFNNIDRLHNSLAVSSAENQVALNNFREYTSSSHNLYDILIQPVARDITNKNLTIIQDGILGYVSFETLLTKEVKSSKVDYRNLPYLIIDHNVNNAYSCALLINARSKKSPVNITENFLAFAPARFGGENNGGELAYNERERGERMINLPGSEKEVRNIQKIVGGKIYLDSTATKSRFINEASNYRILHIATHGIVDNNNPMYSKLVFYPEKSSTNNYLTTTELFNMHLNAELAVLSACKTGYGKNVKGEGLMTLSRGFLYSGVPSLVISLWNVNDQSSAGIMENFYKYLKEGYTKDESLRRSKLDYLRSADNISSNPYYWASFVNVGNNKPMEFVNSRHNMLWLLLLPLVLGIFAGFVKIIRSKLDSDRLKSSLLQG